MLNPRKIRTGAAAAMCYAVLWHLISVRILDACARRKILLVRAWFPAKAVALRIIATIKRSGPSVAIGRADTALRLDAVDTVPRMGTALLSGTMLLVRVTVSLLYTASLLWDAFLAGFMFPLNAVLRLDAA